MAPRVLRTFAGVTSDGELRVMEQALALLAPLDSTAQQRVLRWLVDRLTTPATAKIAVPGLALTDFLAEKAPQTRIEAATCIAYWWDMTEGGPIGTGDLGRLNEEAGLPGWSDPGSTAQGAMSTRRWLERAPGQGRWRVSDEGRRMVEALPDRALITGKKAYA